MTDSAVAEVTEIRPETVLPEILPFSSLNSTVEEIAQILGVDPKSIHALESKLPVRVNPNFSFFSRGSLGISQGQHGPEATVSFSNPDYLEAADVESRWVRVEELFHWIHFAHNPSLVVEQLAINQAKAKNVGDAPYFPPDTLLYHADLPAHTAQAIKDFRVQANLSEIKPDPDKPNPQILLDLMRQKKLTPDEMITIYRSLNSHFGLPEDEFVENRIGEYEYYSLLMTQVDWGEPFGEVYYTAKDHYEYLGSMQRESQNLIFSSVARLLNATIDKAGSETVRQLLAEANLSPQSVRYQSQAAKEAITHLPAQAAIDSLRHYLNGQVTVADLLRISLPLRVSDLGRDLLIAQQEQKVVPPEMLEATRNALLQKLDQSASQGLTAEDERGIKTALSNLLENKLRGAAAKSQFAVALTLAFDDLPADPVARAKFLSNPDYIRMHQQAMLQLIRDALNIPDLSLERFTIDANYAQSQALKVLPQPFADAASLEFAEFIAEVQGGLENSLLSGPLPEAIEQSAQKHAEIKAIEIKNQDQAGLPSTDLDAKSRQAALAESINDVNVVPRKSPILVEPIAKVIAAIATHTPVEDIEYPEGMWLNYPRLLRDQSRDPKGAFMRWHKLLKEFVEKIGGNRSGWTVLQNFLRADELGSQQQIVSNYLGVTI